MKLTQVFAVGLSLGLTASAALADTTLRYSNWLPTTHPFMSDVILPWIEEVKTATDGRVSIELLPKVVGTVPTQFEVVRDGLADVSLIVDGYSAGRFNLNGIIELPFLGNDARAISVAYWRIYKKHLEQYGEYENAIPVAKTSVGPMALITGEGPIASVDDIKGLKVRVANSNSSKIAAELGAAPVNKPVSEMFELVSTGVVDGMISTTETVKSYKMAGPLLHALTIPGGFSGAGITFVVNEDALNAMSAEDLEAFWSVSGEAFSMKIAEVYRGLNMAGRKDLVDAGGSVSEASDAMLAELQEQLDPISQAWVDNAKKLGMENAEEVLAEFRDEIAKAEAELAGN